VKTNILNGMLLLAPLAVLVIIVEKVFELAQLVAKPMERFYAPVGISLLHNVPFFPE